MRQEQLFREFSRGHKFSFRKLSAPYKLCAAIQRAKRRRKMVVFGFATQFGVARITREIRNLQAKFTGCSEHSVKPEPARRRDFNEQLKLYTGTNSDCGQSTALINRSPGRLGWAGKLCTVACAGITGSDGNREANPFTADITRISRSATGISLLGSKKFILVDSGEDWTTTMAKINSDSNEGW